MRGGGGAAAVMELFFERGVYHAKHGHVRESKEVRWSTRACWKSSSGYHSVGYLDGAISCAGSV